MFELLLATDGAAGNKTYPLSGPGPKTLVNGNEQLGYFGELSSSEFINLSELRDQLNFNIGLPWTPWEGTWVKMFLDGKVIFFPTRKVATGITWNDLYNAGLVYGTDSNGVYPTATPTNQLRYVSTHGSAFKVRNFKGSTDDPSNLGSIENYSSTTNEQIKGSEWYRIACAITQPRINNYFGPWWPKYLQTTYLLPNDQVPFALAQESRAAVIGNSLTINNTQVAPSNPKTTTYAWFPVLELEPDPSYLFPLVKVTGVGTEMKPPLATGEADTAFEKPTNFIGGFNGVSPINNVSIEYTV